MKNGEKSELSYSQTHEKKTDRTEKTVIARSEARRRSRVAIPTTIFSTLDRRVSLRLWRISPRDDGPFFLASPYSFKGLLKSYELSAHRDSQEVRYTPACSLIQLTSAGLGMPPVLVATSWPPLKSIRVGMLRMP